MSVSSDEIKDAHFMALLTIWQKFNQIMQTNKNQLGLGGYQRLSDKYFEAKILELSYTFYRLIAQISIQSSGSGKS